MKTKSSFSLVALALAGLTFCAPTFAQTTAKLTTLISFAPTAGQQYTNGVPRSGLVQSGDLLYGTVSIGGNGGGAIYQMTLGGELTALYGFDAVNGNNANATGAYPSADLLDAGDGSFYGTTFDGGPTSGGTIFHFTPGAGTMILHSFTGQPGNQSQPNYAAPVGALVPGGDGKFYGVTENSGASYNGEIYSIAPDGTFATLFSFSPKTGGTSPMAGLVVGADGALYGTTANPGTLFRFTTDGTYTTICNIPRDCLGLTAGRDGSFYGAAGSGANGAGSIFRVTTDGTESVIYTFTKLDSNLHNADGATPDANIIEGTDGNFYGVTYQGGREGSGTIFQVTPAGALTTLHTFSGGDGIFPTSDLVEASNGAFYGTTRYGGKGSHIGGQQGFGTVFKLVVSPAITSGATATGRLGQAFSYQIATTFPATHYGVVGLPKGLSVNGDTGLISGTPEVSGVFTLTINAVNDGGKGTLTLTLTIHGPPVVTSGSATVTEGTAFSYQIKATNAPTGYGVLGLPKGLHVDGKTGLISGTPEVAGTFTLTLNAVNTYGKGSGTLTLTLRGTPVVTGAATAQGKVGSAFSYQITATNAPTSYGVLGLPPGLKVDGKTGLISGTPTSSGTHTLTLQANNTAGTGSAMLKLTIQGVPIITSAVSAKGKVGRAFSFQITATDDPTVFGVLGLPKGLTVNGKTGLISGTPAVAGTFTLTIKATNAVGTGSQNVTLTVKSS